MDNSALLCINHPDADAPVTRCARCLRPFCTHCIVTMSGRPFCGDCKLEQLRDVQSGVAKHSLPLATVGRRWAALIIDRLLVFVPLVIGVIIFALIVENNESTAVVVTGVTLLVLWAVAAFLYEPILTARTGQTVGKKMLGVRVVRTDGSKITSGQAWGRSLGRMLIAMASSLIDYLPALFTDERTTVHDLMASTRVIREL